MMARNWREVEEEHEAFINGDYELAFADPGGNSALRAATYDHCQRCEEEIDEEEFMEWIPSGSNAEAIEYRYICQSCDITLEIVEE